MRDPGIAFALLRAACGAPISASMEQASAKRRKAQHLREPAARPRFAMFFSTKKFIEWYWSYRPNFSVRDLERQGVDLCNDGA